MHYVSASDLLDLDLIAFHDCNNETIRGSALLHQVKKKKENLEKEKVNLLKRIRMFKHTSFT